MSADTLRRAASLMRERAEGATPGPWDECAVKTFEGTYDCLAPTGTQYEICRLPRTPQGSADSWHLASWHPAVALAVADWLDAEASRVERHHLAVTFDDFAVAAEPKALAVARAYLGEAS